MPVDYSNYPPNWFTEIRPRILAREGNRCKFCKAPNKTYVCRGAWGGLDVYQDDDGAIYRADNGECIGDSYVGDVWEEKDGGLVRIVLTVAHLDHNTGNNEDENLAALCQRCHLRWDAALHKKNSRETRMRKRGLQDMFQVDDNKEPIQEQRGPQPLRAFGLYQPFASLMLQGKLETRNRPTNVRGPVLLYSTVTGYNLGGLAELDFIGPRQAQRIYDALKKEATAGLAGYAICLADLTGCRPMKEEDEDACFVRYQPGKWVWLFEQPQRIEPFRWQRNGRSLGKQGWSIVQPEEKRLINFIK